jgi:hypothetical protein
VSFGDGAVEDDAPPPPPVEVIVEKTELLPEFPLIRVVSTKAPPAPTVTV